MYCFARNLWAPEPDQTHDGIFHSSDRGIYRSTKEAISVRGQGLDNGLGSPCLTIYQVQPTLVPLSPPWDWLKVGDQTLGDGLYLLGGWHVFLICSKKQIVCHSCVYLYLTTPYLPQYLYPQCLGTDGYRSDAMGLVVLQDFLRREIALVPSTAIFLYVYRPQFLAFLFLPIYAIIVYFKYRDV